MRLVARLVWVVGLWGLAVGGCNDVYTAPASLDLTIKGAAGLLEGVRVCEGDTNCAVSDANGEVALEVPADQEIFYTLQKEGYDSFLFAHIIPKSGFSKVWSLNTDAQSAEGHEILMTPYPRRGTGQISIFLSPGFAGATFDLINATGKIYYEVTPYEYPYYDFDLEATTDNGAGGFVEVTPSTVQIQLGGTAQRCIPNFAWPGEVENSVRVPVRDDHDSIVVVTCALPL